MARRDQTLYRDENEKILGGVCSGIGQYFDIDTNLVRVGFVMLRIRRSWGPWLPDPVGHSRPEAG